MKLTSCYDWHQPDESSEGQIRICVPVLMDLLSVQKQIIKESKSNGTILELLYCTFANEPYCIAYTEITKGYVIAWLQ